MFLWKLLKIFRTDIFYVTPLDSWYTILIVPAPSFLSYFAFRYKKATMIDQLRILCWKPSWLAMYWRTRNTLIQSSIWQMFTKDNYINIMIWFYFKTMSCEKKKFQYTFFIPLTQWHEFFAPKLTNFCIFINLFLWMWHYFQRVLIWLHVLKQITKQVALEGFLKKQRDVCRSITTANIELFVALFISFQLLLISQRTPT